MNDNIIKEGFLCSFDINQARMAKKEILVILSTLNTNNNSLIDNSINKNNFIIEKLGSIKNMCIIFNKTNQKPTEIKKELDNQLFKFKYIKRIVPLDIIITKDYKKHLKEYLINKDIEGSFKIFYRSRCSDKDIKDDIFQIILKRYEDKKVDLVNPSYGIYVEVVTKYIGFSVIKI